MSLSSVHVDVTTNSYTVIKLSEKGSKVNTREGAMLGC